MSSPHVLTKSFFDVEEEAHYNGAFPLLFQHNIAVFLSFLVFDLNLNMTDHEDNKSIHEEHAIHTKIGPSTPRRRSHSDCSENGESWEITTQAITFDLVVPTTPSTFEVHDHDPETETANLQSHVPTPEKRADNAGDQEQARAIGTPEADMQRTLAVCIATLRNGKANSRAKNAELAELGNLMASLKDSRFGKCPNPDLIFTPDGSTDEEHEFEDDDYFPSVVMVWKGPHVDLSIMTGMVCLDGDSFFFEEQGGDLSEIISALCSKFE